MDNRSSDAINNLSQLLIEFQTKTEYIIERHEQRVALLKEIQADLRQILNKLTGGR